MRVARWVHLPDEDEEFRCWHENLARGSGVTADEPASVLYRFLSAHGLSPRKLVKMAMKDRRKVEALILLQIVAILALPTIPVVPAYSADDRSSHMYVLSAPSNRTVTLMLRRGLQGYEAGSMLMVVPGSYEFKDLVITVNTGVPSKILVYNGTMASVPEAEGYRVVAKSFIGVRPYLFWRMRGGTYTILVIAYSGSKPLGFVEVEFRVFTEADYGWVSRALEPNALKKWRQMPLNVLRDSPIAILVGSEEYRFIKDCVERFAWDLYFTTSIRPLVCNVSFKNPLEVRDFLRHLYYNTSFGISGAILVGRVPLPFMWGKDGGYYTTRFYEDLDGLFKFNSRGFITLWNNTNGLEIWVSLIRPPRGEELSKRMEANSYRRYFEKNHLYKTGFIRVPFRVAAFIDMDWRTWVKQYDEEISTLTRYEGEYLNVGGLLSVYRIKADEYWYYMEAGYGLSTGWVHGGFQFAGGGEYERGGRRESTRGRGPGALVHIMSTCGFSNINETWCHALSFLMGRSITLATIGPSGSEGILEAYALFGPLGEGAMLGDAFLYWLNYRFTDDPWTSQSRFRINTTTHSWGLSMVMFGDPTLLIRGEPVYVEAGSPLIASPGSEIGVRLVDNSMSPVCGYPVMFSINADGSWRYLGHCVTDEGGLATIKLPELEEGVYKLAVYSRGFFHHCRLYKPTLRYLDLYIGVKPADTSPPSLEVVGAEDEVANLPSLNLTAVVKDDVGVESVIASYSVDHGKVYTVSMMKVGKDRYFVRIPVRRGSIVRFSVRAFDKSGNLVEGEGRFKISEPSLIEVVLRSPLVSAIIIVSCFIFLAVFIVRCFKARKGRPNPIGLLKRISPRLIRRSSTAF